MHIEFANASFSKAIGVKEDIIVMLKDCHVHVDLYVIDMPKDAHVPIILGRPLLRTSGAIIICKKVILNLLCPIERLSCISLRRRRRH